MPDTSQPAEGSTDGSLDQADPKPPQRVLALDVGDRRIGLAISDPLGYTAQPLFTLRRMNPRADIKSIARLARKHAVTDVVIGLPLHAGGELSPQAVKTQAFADALRKTLPGPHYHLLDERLTTAEAHTLLDQSHSRKPRGKADRLERTAIIDQGAAVLLLETFLSASSPRLLPPPPGF